jgi:hypothetical protein
LGLQGNDLYLSNLAAFFYPFISVPLNSTSLSLHLEHYHIP